MYSICNSFILCIPFAFQLQYVCILLPFGLYFICTHLLFICGLLVFDLHSNCIRVVFHLYLFMFICISFAFHLCSIYIHPICIPVPISSVFISDCICIWSRVIFVLCVPLLVFHSYLYRIHNLPVFNLQKVNN